MGDDIPRAFDRIADVVMRLGHDPLVRRRAVAAILVSTVSAIAVRLIGGHVGRCIVADARHVGIAFSAFATATVAARARRAGYTYLPGHTLLPRNNLGWDGISFARRTGRIA